MNVERLDVRASRSFSVSEYDQLDTPAVRLIQIGNILKRSAKSADAVKIDGPDAYIKAAKKIKVEPPEPKIEDGKPVEVFTYFFYVPGNSNIVVVDLDKPLEQSTMTFYALCRLKGWGEGGIFERILSISFSSHCWRASASDAQSDA